MCLLVFNMTIIKIITFPFDMIAILVVAVLYGLLEIKSFYDL